MKMSYVTSNILIVCFGIKKCMLSTKKAIASVFGSVTCVSVLSILKEKRYPVCWVAGDANANGHRTPNMPVNKKLQKFLSKK